MAMLQRFTIALALTTSLVTAPMAFAKQPKAAPISQLVSDVKLPYETFTLDNGLRVVVHEDRKAPVVAVSMWYRVGSKHEPAGKTGFAHLFEHLMFSGSENAPGDFISAIQRIGATSLNGTTWYDRTNYFQTVPTGALDRALFLESDRMGHLLGAVTQKALDNQRSVVQNEKRQRDNSPYGLLFYELGENLMPKGHPYRHSVIGSMDDLNSANLDDVKNWFRDNYGPNNAVLALAGDIDVATARKAVEKWFGGIPRGPAVRNVVAPVVTLPAAVHKEVTDMVPGETVFRSWVVPGAKDADNAPLSLGIDILAGLSSSRLSNSLVRKDPVAVSASSLFLDNEDAAVVLLQAIAKDGVTSDALAKAMDEQVAAFLQSGPTQDEVDRAVTSRISSALKSLDLVGGFGGKAPILAEGFLYANDPNFFLSNMQGLAKITPQQIKTAMNKWLSRPVFGLVYKPGTRTEGGENRGGANFMGMVKAEPFTYRDPNASSDSAPVHSGTVAAPDRSKLPEITNLAGLTFPKIERTRLANGIELVFARRASLPLVHAAVSFDAGYAADPRGALGTQNLMLDLMGEGTKSLDSIKLAEAQERLGASISGSASADNTIFTLSALKANLTPSLDLLADYIRNPAFDPSELERMKAAQIVKIRAELTDPSALGSRVLYPAIYGANHPYGVPSSGLGSLASVSALTRDNVSQFHSQWIRPDNARIFVVGDTTLAEVARALNASIGKWRSDGSKKPVKDFSQPAPRATSRILLVDRPNSPQSLILAGRALALKGPQVSEVLKASDSILGGGFASRINQNLRETKGWSYGAHSGLTTVNDQVLWYVAAPVQSDRTGDSLAEIRRDVGAFVSSKSVTDEELRREVTTSVRTLPGRFETTGSVLNALITIDRLGRPDDYYTQLPAMYRGMTVAQVKNAAQESFRTDDLIYVVVGDAKSVRPQLEALDLPIETVSLSN